MNKVFLYDNKLDLGLGHFASVGGFKLVTAGFNECVEAVPDTNGRIYGYIYEVNDGVLGMLDMYYGLGIELHQRITTTAVLEGGVEINVDMYEYNLELV
jgi:gamma-glutamylcyclotransferase (GGCT)/AIG2-like uncharacterized protein YtfP